MPTRPGSMAMKKIGRQSVSGQVFAALRQDILDGVFGPGDRLPSEGKLSEDMGVSKSTVKAAVQRLVALGLLETRRGEGNFVREFDAGRYLDQVHEFLLSDQDLSNITEYRMFIEMAATRLAIKKAGPENFRRMEECLAEMEEAVRGDDVVRHGKCDFEFHLEICRATQNEIFVLAYNVIGKMLRQHATALNEGYFDALRRQKKGEDVHWELYRAIKDGNLETCRQCFARMFAVFGDLPEEIVNGS